MYIIVSVNVSIEGIEIYNRFMEYIKDLKQAESIISLPDEQQKRAFEQINAQRREKLQAIIKQQEDAAVALQEASRRVEVYENEQRDTLRKLSGIEQEMGLLTRAFEDFQYAEQLDAGDVQDTEIQQQNEELEKIESEITHAKTQQLELCQDQSAKKGLGLQNTFDEIVHRVLKADYSGSVITSVNVFTPQIRRASVITGAAVESLSFILMDIASMLASSQGIGHHPGFLVHDSPREADLDIGPYHSFLTELASITTESGGRDNAPFQYIVTTTTEPPTALEPFVNQQCQLAAYPDEKMLFREKLDERNLFSKISGS